MGLNRKPKMSDSLYYTMLQNLFTRTASSAGEAESEKASSRTGQCSTGKHADLGYFQHLPFGIADADHIL